MPIFKVGNGYRFGRSGKVYKGLGARDKAVKQGRAIAMNKTRRK